MESISSNKLNIILGGYSYNERDREACNSRLYNLVSRLNYCYDIYKGENHIIDDAVSNFRAEGKAWSLMCAQEAEPYLFVDFVVLIESDSLPEHKLKCFLKRHYK